MIKTLQSSLVIGSLALMSVTLYAQSVKAQQWFRCPNGWTFETQNNRARCIQGEQRTRVQPDAGCPVGTTFNQDHRGNTDYCLPVTGTLGGRPIAAACGPGEEKETRRGRDRCYNVRSATSRAVDVPIN